MNNTMKVLVISVVLVAQVFLMYAPPFAAHPWASFAGVSQEVQGTPQALPFIVMFIGWVLYGLIFRWIYSGMKMSGLRDATMLGVRLWLFVALPVIAVHYLFLQFSWFLILIDGFSQLVAMIIGGILLWGWTLQPVATDEKN
jgi:hypothetical protein